MNLKKFSVGQDLYILIMGFEALYNSIPWKIVLYKAEIISKNASHGLLIVRVKQSIINNSIIGETNWIGNNDVVKLNLKEVAETLEKEFDKQDLICLFLGGKR